MLYNEEIKTVAIESYASLKALVSQSVSQSVSQQKNLLMQRFRVDLKTLLGLAMPNQYSQTVRKQILSWFWGDNFGPKSPNLHDPYI